MSASAWARTRRAVGPNAARRWLTAARRGR